MDGESGPGGDLALVGTFFLVVLVGTFASQVRQAGRQTGSQAMKALYARWYFVSLHVDLSCIEPFIKA